MRATENPTHVEDHSEPVSQNRPEAEEFPRLRKELVQDSQQEPQEPREEGPFCPSLALEEC